MTNCGFPGTGLLTASLHSFLRMIIAASLFAACSRHRIETHPELQSITESVYASGIVKTKDQYEAYAPVTGLIEKIYVSKGATVNKGDALFKIRNETARLAIDNSRLNSRNSSVQSNADKLNELKANLVSLENKMRNDSLLMQRQRNLWSQGIGTRNELEQRELAYKNDRLSYEAGGFHIHDFQKQLLYTEAVSKNNLQISRLQAGDFIVRSKLTGRVYTITREEGEIVTAQTPMAIVGNAGDFFMELQVDEYDISRVRPGQKVLVSMDSYQNKVFDATVTNIIPIMNDRTRSFTVEAVFIQPPPALFPNLTAEANIIILSKENALTIPREYLLADSMVMLASGKQARVVTGLKDYQKAEIIKGLTINDRIIKPDK